MDQYVHTRTQHIARRLPRLLEIAAQAKSVGVVVSFDEMQKKEGGYLWRMGDKP